MLSARALELCSIMVEVLYLAIIALLLVPGIQRAALYLHHVRIPSSSFARYESPEVVSLDGVTSRTSIAEYVGSMDSSPTAGVI